MMDRRILWGALIGVVLLIPILVLFIFLLSRSGTPDTDATPEPLTQAAQLPTQAGDGIPTTLPIIISPQALQPTALIPPTLFVPPATATPTLAPPITATFTPVIFVPGSTIAPTLTFAPTQFAQPAAAPLASFTVVFEANQTVAFTDTSRGNIVSWLWNFGDGTFSNERFPRHTFANVGNYTVILTVTTGDGQTASATAVVTILPPTPSFIPPTLTFTPTFTLTHTPTVTWTPSQTFTPLPPVFTLSPTWTFTPSLTFTAFPTETETPIPTATETPLPTETETPIPTATETALQVPTSTEMPLPTLTESPVPTETETPLPTETETPIPTATETETPIPTATETALQVPTSTEMPLPTLTESPVPTETETPLPTETETLIPTATETPLPTETETPLPTLTETPIPTATETPLPTETETPLPTLTETPLPTETETPLPTLTETPLPTETETPLPTLTETPLPTETETPIPTETETPLPTETETPLPTLTETPLPTETETPIPTATETPLPTETETPIPTATETPIPTETETPIPTATETETPIPTETETPIPTATATETPIPTETETPTPEAPAWTALEVGAARCEPWFIYQAGNEIVTSNGENVSQGQGSAPGLSPDRRYITFSTERDGNPEIYIAAVDGSLLQRATENDVPDTNPVWSPDGLWIVFESGRDLVLLNVQTGEQTPLVSNGVNAFWFQNSNRLIYQSDRDGLWQIYSINISNGNERRESDGTANDTFPQYSPDGTRIIFRSDREGGGIFIMNADGTGITRIAEGANASNPVWSANGALAAYQSNIDGDLDIYIFDVASGVTRQLTNNTVPDYAPAWLCSEPVVFFNSDIFGDPDIFSAPALPIDAPPVAVENPAEATQHTTSEGADLYPQNFPLRTYRR